MLTREDLLLEGIKLPDKEEQAPMALPPSLNSSQGQTKKNHLFSPAIFKEAWRSHRLGLLIVSAWNALIMVVIIAILSTLHINSTSDALKSMFSNADTENTIKSGAIALYSTYSYSAKAYETFLDANDQAYTLINTEINEISDETLSSSLDQAKQVYNLAYSMASGDETSKNAIAKGATIELINVNLDSNTNYTEDEKEVAKEVISLYLDEYSKDKEATNATILRKVAPTAFSNVIAKKLSLEETTRSEIESLFTAANRRVLDDKEDQNRVVTSQALNFLPLVATGEEKEFASKICTGLLEKYTSNPDAYLNDSSIRNDDVSSSCQDYIMEMLSDFAYYQYLPSFTVEYETSELGYPIRLVGTGTYADNGNEIMKEVEIKKYNPENYIKVTEKMGKSSNLLEKMHKDLLTGEGYTEEEISSAKSQAKDNLSMIQDRLSHFMGMYLSRDSENSNSFYDGENRSIREDAISSLAVDEITYMGEVNLIDFYNKENDPDVSSIDEITVENYSMSGEEIVSLIKGYASSGISSFNTYSKQASEKGYSQVDSLLVSMNKASSGIIAQLPSSVMDSLSELGNMNTYGIIVGVVAFDIAALLIPLVYTILTAKSLVSEKVESGSLAFTLSTPTTRDSFIFTQAAYLLFTEVVMAVTVLVISIFSQMIGIALGSEDLARSLPISDICYYSLGNFMITLAISGINFLASCHFNKTNYAIGAGGGLTIFFYICLVLGLFATKATPGTFRIQAMNIFNYMTINSFYDPLAVMEGNYSLYWFKLMFLLIIAVVTYLLGAWNFRKKDLPL